MVDQPDNHLNKYSCFSWSQALPRTDEVPKVMVFQKCQLFFKHPVDVSEKSFRSIHKHPFVLSVPHCIASSKSKKHGSYEYLYPDHN